MIAASGAYSRIKLLMNVLVLQDVCHVGHLSVILGYFQEFDF